MTGTDAAWRCWTWRTARCCGCGRAVDCLLTTPPPAPCEQAEYDVITLGLMPHPRENCACCQAVGA